MTERCGVRSGPDGEREFVITGMEATGFGFAALFVLLGPAAAAALVSGHLHDGMVRFYAWVFVVVAPLMLGLIVARIFGREVFLVRGGQLVRRNEIFGFSRQERWPLAELAQLDGMPALASLPIRLPGMRGLQREIDTWRLAATRSGRFLYLSGRPIRSHTLVALLSVLAEEHPALLELASEASIAEWATADERHDRVLRRVVAAFAILIAATFSTMAVMVHDAHALLVVPAVVGAMLALFVGVFPLWNGRRRR